MDISAILARGSSGSSGEDVNLQVGGGGGKREEQYKKKGNQLDKRALRQIQEDERRKVGRSKKQEQGRVTRNIPDDEEENQVVVETNRTAALTRKEKLDEYLKNKKKVELKKRKEAKPTFRPGGKYKDLNPIAPSGAPSNNASFNNTKRVNSTGINTPVAISNRMNHLSRSSRANTPNRLLVKPVKSTPTPAKRTTRAAAKKKIVPEVSVEPPSSGGSSNSSVASSKSSASSNNSNSFAPASFSFDFRMSAPSCSAPISSTPAKPQLRTATTSSLPVVTEMEDEVFAAQDVAADLADEAATADDDASVSKTEINTNLNTDLHINSVSSFTEEETVTAADDDESINKESTGLNEMDPVDQSLPDSPSISTSLVRSEEFTKEEVIETNINKDSVEKTKYIEVDNTDGRRTELDSHSSEDGQQSQSSEEDNVDKDCVSTQSKRRSRRRSGIQPDPQISQEELLLTPARRAKRRSASRERRKSGCQMCPGELCPSTPRSVHSLPSLEESQEESDSQVKEEIKYSEIVARSTRRSTRLSQSQGTPAINLGNKLNKVETFKTPGKVGDKVPNVVANWISSERGSSKRKKPGMDRKSFSETKPKNSISTLFDDLDSSPVLALLERKAKSAEDINDEDFLEHEDTRPNKIVKLDMDQFATEDKQETEVANTIYAHDKSLQETTTSEVDEKSSDDIVRDVPYFRSLIVKETERLTKLGDLWENKLLDNIESISEDIQGSVRTCVGQARLVMSERFAQFSGLVDDCEYGRGERETTTQDLTGFWEMIYFQVEDVDKKFKELEKVENNRWQEPENVKEVKPVIKVAKPKKIVKKKAAAISGLRAMIAAKRQAVSTTEVEEKTSDGNTEKQEVVTSVTEEKDAKRLAVREMIAKKKAELAKQRAEAVGKSVSEKSTDEKPGTTFDGGFFAVKSPARERPSPARLSKSTGGDRLRRSVVITETARRVSGMMVSPFVSQLGKRSRDNTPAKDESSKDKSPKTYSKGESPTNSSRQRQLEATFDNLVTSPSPTKVSKHNSSTEVKETHWSTDSSDTGDEVKVRFTPGLKTEEDNEMTAPTTPHPKSGTKLDSSPSLGRRSRVSLMPMAELDQVETPTDEVGDQELISFVSPVENNRRKSTRNQS